MFSLLLVGNGMDAWGQDFTITKSQNRETVHTRTQIIYVDQSRDLYVPELRINDASTNGNRDYAWYVHWYGSKGTIQGKNVILDKNWATQRGGTIKGGTYISDLQQSIDGLWWYEGFGTENHNNPKNENLSQKQDNNGYWLHLASCASTITYTRKDIMEDVLICDVSNYRDYNYTATNFQEPTLLKRYKYIIRPASECADILMAGKPMEVYYIDFPKGEKNINFSMLSLPENYFWYNDNKGLVSGSSFLYSIGSEEGKYEEFSYDQVQKIDLSMYESAVTVYVKAQNENNSISPVLATYTFNPITDSGFLLENEIPDDRKPEIHKNLYEEIGFVDFDIMDNKSEELNFYNNISDKPLSQSETTYGFMYKNLPPMRTRVTSAQNQYGLYRSAGHQTVSENDVNYDFQEGGSKNYLWIPKTGTGKDKYMNTALYDRTHSKNNNEYGYFYYIDASDDPGTIIDVKINGTLCGYTELIVTAWLSDMTRAYAASNGNFPLAPNINLILKGTRNKGDDNEEEVILHRFTSGDAKVNYEAGINQNLMQWQQLCYKININDEAISGCSDFHLEVQNNEPHTDGADYAIDDVRIYMSTPNISVRRENACTSSTLVVSSDYGTLLRNMGWNENPNVLDGVDLSDKNIRKYRYGLMGPDPYTKDPHRYIGNVYYGVTENLESPSAGENVDDWVTLNKSLYKNESSEDPAYHELWKRLSKTMRVAVPTQVNEYGGNGEGYEEIPGEAARAVYPEIVMNLRAINDFISDTEAKPILNADGSLEEKGEPIWSETELKEGGLNIKELKSSLNDLGCEIAESEYITGVITVEDNALLKIAEKGSDQNKLYEETLLKVYTFLQIPRIHCPWMTTNKEEQTLFHLGSINVENTDLKFKGEKDITTGEEASGEYEVILFSAREVTSSPESREDWSSIVRFNNPCLLHSPFTVQPSYTITVNTSTGHEGTACREAIAKVTPELWVEEIDQVGNPTGNMKTFKEAYNNETYTFDWFLGTEEAYSVYSKQFTGEEGTFGKLQALIKKVRDTRSGDNKLKASKFDKEAINNTELTDKEKDLLINLLGDATTEPLLIIGNGEESVEFLWTEDIVALPYVPNITSPSNQYIFCTEPQKRTLDALDSPALSVGFPEIEYPELFSDVPLRLGLQHIKPNQELTVPIQKNVKFGSDGKLFAMSNETGGYDIKVYNETTQEHIKVATLLELSATKEDGGSVKFSFENNSFNFEEGKTYTLYIPFAEFDKSENEEPTPIEGSCPGLATLQIKIVPEYLTWNGNNDTETWYDEGDYKTNEGSKWHISTKTELYGKVDNESSTPTFAPLYFTNTATSINP